MNGTHTVPTHIAIIMDGNRRWAKERSLPPLAGHQQVVDKVLEPLIEQASKRGVKYLTFWAWSTENWERDKREVEGIMKIFKHLIARKWEKLHKQGIRIKIIGDMSKFDMEIRHALEQVIEQTKNNSTITATFALNYGGRDEIIRAINTLHGNAKFQMPNFKLTEEVFSNSLDTAGIPDPDLIIRTGGEQRLSGFLSWQSEYSELFFVKWYMPEFTPEKLDEILTDFNERQRRFGR